MRTYVIDEIMPEHTPLIEERLDSMELGSGMPGLYWLPIPADMLSEVQVEHQESCGPHCMALELGEGYLRLELLVRARNILRCGCIAYASPELEKHMMNYVDTMLKDLGFSL